MGQLLQRNLQLSLLSHFLYSFISSQFSLLISISFLIWSIHQVLGIPLDRFPFIFGYNIFLHVLSSPIHITCSNLLNLIFCMSFLFHSPPCSYLMLVFLIVSFFVLFKIALNNLISMAWILLSSLLLPIFLLHIVIFSLNKF